MDESKDELNVIVEGTKITITFELKKAMTLKQLVKLIQGDE